MFIPDLAWSAANVDGKRSEESGFNSLITTLCIIFDHYKWHWNVTPIRKRAYLDDPVLGRPAALPLEHGVDAVGLRHADGLGLGAGGGRGHVPLSGVLVQLEVVEPLEGRLRAQDHLVAIILRENKWEPMTKGEREISRKQSSTVDIFDGRKNINGLTYMTSAEKKGGSRNCRQ